MSVHKPRLQPNTFPLKDLNQKNIAAGLVAGIFIITGPSALILEASSSGNFTIDQTILWVLSVYVMGGLFGIILPLYYRIPIVGGHTLTGIAFLATMTTQFTFHELIGAYIFSGMIMLLVGLSGFFSKLINLVPKEIISAMLAGMITKYMVTFIQSVNQLFIVGISALVTFFLFSVWKTKIPPLIAAIVTGSIVLILTYPLNTESSWSSGFLLPQLQAPDFNLVSFLSISIPLSLLILSNDAAVAIGALQQNQYKTPVNRIVSFGGGFSIFTSFLGGHSANIAGMATAICADEAAGPKEKRYMGAVVSGLLLFGFGSFAWKLVPLIHTLPSEFISIIVGFSLLGVFGNSLQQGFANPSLKLSAAFAFMIAMSDITLLNISAPVWSLLVGAIIARYVENNSAKKSEKIGKKTA
ncbi:benzoate/H(+) symporter BenE family transporter [Mesobacillus maritimus]|uniref:benzoate/H(+) symporter BenE family transporter n=1 Tax=Mesobacillus maritimus TaxID=1643336 RepID=UPI00203FE20F|nr:benzoate/H(+) symporter BenE family transporter [Mesobacillus maritimus]MCM3587522.1 benzoate/H(+) symporter BenE family transporter [Mesobacillus maritimus]MCM3671168.1 benzoate/H(+) symporter BenE family transporter [Mesobacillus maritimus]